MINSYKIIRELFPIQEMSLPTGLLFYMDYSLPPDGELFMPALVPCERAGSPWCYRGTNYMHNCPCVKCDGTGWLTP